MSDAKDRRERGVYPTPPRFAGLAHDYLTRLLGDGIYDMSGEGAIWWDPCAGEGALLARCKSHTSTLASDLVRPDIPHTFCSEFDFLNDEGLPDHVSLILSTRDEDHPYLSRARWIFILNPPYGSGVGGQYLPDGEAVRRGLSDTMVGKQMRKAKMGLATRNMACQFIWRVENIIRENGLDAIVALFSPAAILNGPGYGRFRDGFWHLESRCLGGFCFNSKHFDNIEAEWPVCFSVWERGKQDGPVVLDVFEEDRPAGHPRTKAFSFPKRPLSALPSRPKGTIVRPPMNGPLSVATKGILVDRQAPGALASIYADGNDVQHSTSSCYITTGPNPHTGSWSITPDNFEDSMLLFACRRLVKPNWLNWRDQFSEPDREHPHFRQFEIDAILWGLFEEKNLTSSLGNVVYRGQTFDIPNHFFWMTPEEMMEIPSLPRPIWQQCHTAKPRFVSTWLQKHEDEFCDDAQEVLHLGKEMVRVSAPLRPHALLKFQLDRHDAGWYQIRMGLFGIKDIPFQQTEEMIEAMGMFRIAHNALGCRIRPMISELGIIS